MLKILLCIMYLHITLPYGSHHVFIDLKNYNGEKTVPSKYVEFPPIYLFLFLFLCLCFVGYVRMRTDCSNCSNFYELVYRYSASGSGLMLAVDSAGEYVKPIALSQVKFDMHSCVMVLSLL